MKAIFALKRGFVNAIRVGWFLALRQVKRGGKGTTTLIIFIMVLTFLNLVVVSGLLMGLITGSFQAFRESYSGEVLVTPAPMHDYIENSAALIPFLENHPRVTGISPRHSAGVTILGTLTDLPGKNERQNKIAAQLVGIDPAKEEAVTRFSRFIIKGQALQEGEDGYMVLGGNFLRNYSDFADANIPGIDFLSDVDVGNRVRVMLVTKDGAVVQKDFIVKGIAKTKVDQVSTRFFVNAAELKRMIPVNKEQYEEIAVNTDIEYAPQLVQEIKTFLGSDARVQTYQEAIPSFLRDIETTMAVLGNALSSIALVVASITVFIVIFINAVTKRKFIGIMKGIGVSPLAIEISYIFQALFYGVVGSAIGLFITFGLLKPYFDAYPINFPFSDGILVATPFGAGLRVFILLVVTLLAGYIPAKLIVRRNTLDAILGR